MANVNKAFSNAETAAFCNQIAVILQSGISATEGITIMLEDTDNDEERVVLRKILDGLHESGSLTKALRETGMFPEYMINMIEIGEETGRLDDVAASLAAHYEREDELNKSIRNTITYPLIMAGMMVVVIIVLLVKVMPVFNQVFIQLGSEMTGFSRGLMNIGEAIRNYSIALIVILVMIILCALLAVKTPGGRNTARNLCYKFKGTRQLFENTAACRFAGAMALTLSSGLHPERSMELVEALNDDSHFRQKLETCKSIIADGTDMAQAFRDSGIFTGVYSRMASVGQKTGSMDKTMNKIADLYQEEIDNRMNNILAVLEPTLVIALSVIVGIILLSVMFPLMGIMSNL
ncbi:MAG: type II secretion system F family protein [Firmicutes bacterium]|nr:type II secretion system F family protein [Bacillota bacterium]